MQLHILPTCYLTLCMEWSVADVLSTHLQPFSALFLCYHFSRQGLISNNGSLYFLHCIYLFFIYFVFCPFSQYFNRYVFFNILFAAVSVESDLTSLTASKKGFQTQVYSGRRQRFLSKVPTLFDACIRVLKDNLDCK